MLVLQASYHLTYINKIYGTEVLSVLSVTCAGRVTHADFSSTIPDAESVGFPHVDLYALSRILLKPNCTIPLVSMNIDIDSVLSIKTRCIRPLSSLPSLTILQLLLFIIDITILPFCAFNMTFDTTFDCSAISRYNQSKLTPTEPALHNLVEVSPECLEFTTGYMGHLCLS